MSIQNANITHDVAIVGSGIMGAAVSYHLAKQGLTAICLDRFAPPHDRGSSHGQTRLIRRAYFEHPDYAPLVDRAARFWREIEAESGEKLFRQTGLILSGPPTGQLIQGSRRAAQAHKLDIHEIHTDDAVRRFPDFNLAPDSVVLYEPQAGLLHAERCVQTYMNCASALGAVFEPGIRVTGWHASPATVTVETDHGPITAGALALCAGAWSSALLADLNLPLEVRRKVVFWHAVNDGAYQVDDGTPVYGYDVHGGFFYGFPSMDGLTIKVGEHTGGEAVPSPDALDRTLRPDDHPRVNSFVEQYLPHATPHVMKHSVCMYTMTPDEHFIIDRHPAHKNVVFAAGFSGHGFKFAPVVGSVLADLLIKDTTSEPIELFRASRFLRRGNSANDSPTQT